MTRTYSTSLSFDDDIDSSLMFEFVLVLLVKLWLLIVMACLNAEPSEVPTADAADVGLKS